MHLSIDILACVILVGVAVEDVRRFRIRNSAVLCLIALFGLLCLTAGAGTLLSWHAGFAAITLVVMFSAFALGFCGAGDAKLMSAAGFWVGPEGAILFSIALLGLTSLYCLGTKVDILPTRVDGRNVKIPFAPSIVGAWIAAIVMS